MRKNSMNQIKSGALISYFAIGISIVSALLYTPWMKNQIGDSNYGLYTLVSSLISIFLMDFGLGTSVTRFVAKYRAENNQKSIRDTLGYVFKLYLLIDIGIIISLSIVYLFLADIYVGLNKSEIIILRKVFVIFASYSVLAFPFSPLAGILNAYEKFIQLKLCDLFQKLFAIFLIVICLLLDYGVVALVAMNAISGLSAIGIKLYLVLKKTNVKPDFKTKDRALLRGLMGFSIWITILALAQRMYMNLVPSILGITSNSMEIARFAPASQLEGYFFTFANAINGLFLPTIARYVAQGDNKAIDILAKKVGRYQIIVLGLLFTGIATVGTTFVGLWMGEEYEISGFCTMLMIIPSLFLYSQQIFNTLLSVKNKVKYQACASLVTGLMNVVLAFSLTPKYGVLGAAISICITYSTNCIVLNFIYRKYLNQDLKDFYLKVFARYIPLIFLVILSSNMCFIFLDVNGWRGLIIKILIVTILYSAIMIIGGTDKGEREKIKQKLHFRGIR